MFPQVVHRLVFSHDDFIRHYKLGNLIGQGSYGSVCSAVRVVDHLPVAVKYIKKSKIKHWEILHGEIVPREVCLLARLTHISGVAQILDWFDTDYYFALVMERPWLVTNFSNFIFQRNGLKENFARYYFRQILNIVVQCFSERIIHRDLKGDNIIIDLQRHCLKLIDFGMGTYFDQGGYEDGVFGTWQFCAPECVLRKKYYGWKITVWSLGVLLYYMIHNRYPFKSVAEAQTSEVKFYKNISNECKDIIRMCLTKCPSHRPSPKDVIDHPWFTKNLENQMLFGKACQTDLNSMNTLTDK